MFSGEDGCSCTVLASLVSSGVPQECLTPDTARMSTENFAIVRDVTESGPAVLIADVARQTVARQGSSGADSALMCPDDRLLALQSGKTVQVFDLQEKKRVGSCELTSKAAYMVWASPSRLALITKTHVYHWSPKSDDKAKKICERSPEIAGERVTAYAADPTSSWLLLGAGEKLQLYSKEKKASKIMEGDAATFGVVGDSTVIAVAKGDRITALELPTGKKQTATYERRVAEIPLPEGDSVVSLTTCPGGFLTSLSAAGHAHLLDLHNNTLLYHYAPERGAEIIVAAPVSSRRSPHFVGCAGLNRTKGSVLLYEFDMEYIVPNIVRPQHGEQAALDIAGRANLREAIAMYANRFKSLVASGSVPDAIDLAVSAPHGCLRTLETIRSLQGFLQIPGEPPVVMVYFKRLLEVPSKLNKLEGLELAKMVLVKQDGADYIGDLIEQGQLEASEELGARLEETDQDIALACYAAAGSHAKAVELQIQKKNFSGAVKYIQAKMAGEGWTPDWESLITSLIATNAEGALEFALLLLNEWRTAEQPQPAKGGKKPAKKPAGPTPLSETPVRPMLIVEYLVDRGCVKEATRYLLSVLERQFGEAEAEDECAYQTKLFEINLKHSPPQVIESLFSHGKYTKYDAKKTARLCERAGMYQRGLKLYTKSHLTQGGGEIEGVVRCAVNTAGTASQWLPDILHVLSGDDGLQLVHALLEANPRQHSLSVKDAFTTSRHAASLLEKFDPRAITEAFCAHKAHDALFAILSPVVRRSTDSVVHTKYIESAVKAGGQLDELERITRESDHYDPALVMACLGEARLSDPWPFINVCHKHGKWDQLVSHLVATRNLRYLDLFLVGKAPLCAPEVVAALLDASVDEHFILSLVQKAVKCPPADIIAAVSTRGRIAFITPWLEALLVGEAGGAPPCTDSAVVEALARFYIESGSTDRLAVFLKEHEGRYAGKAIGQFAEERGLFQTAFQAYSSTLSGANQGDAKGGNLKRVDSAAESLAVSTPNTPSLDATGGSGVVDLNCDDLVLAMCTSNGLLKELGSYLLRRQSLALWERALEAGAPQRDSVVEEVVSHTLPSVTDPRQLSVAVKAFTQVGMPDRLIQVLEDLVLNNPASPFCHNRYLQNLLLLTIIQTQPQNAMGYIRRMDKYDTEEMAGIALKNNLNEEALEIYKLSRGGEARAMRVLCEVIHDLARAEAFAEEAASDACWRMLGEAHLKGGALLQAVAALTRAKECEHARGIVSAAEAVLQKGGAEADALLVALVGYLRAARAACTSGDVTFLTFADTEVAYLMGRAGQFTELTQFLSTPHLANLTKAGDRCFTEGRLEAARSLFTSDRNHARLASTLLKLGKHLEALDAAQKAGSVKTWKEVCFGCVHAGEKHLAQMAAQHLIVCPDELDEVYTFFERCGCIAELQQLLRTGLNHERVHTGIYTSLAKLLCLYDAKHLQDFLKLHWSKVAHGVILPLCEQERLWAEVAYLQRCEDDHSRALGTMLDHPGHAWTHADFVDSAQKSTVVDVIYAGVSYYAEHHPDLLCDYLSRVTERVSPDKVVMLLDSASKVFLARDWLLAVQKHDTKALNNCINGLLMEEEDYVALRASLEMYRNFDRLELCRSLQGHPLVELRRVASWIHSESGRHQEAVSIALGDKLYADAMLYAAASHDSQVAHNLLQHFINNGLPECFTATLYKCYDFIEPDVAVELAWRHKQQDAAMPYLCQVLRELWDFKKQHSA